MRVLFADDDVISRTLLAAVLTHVGHQSRSAGDGGEAWALFQAEPAPLVVLDVDMPVLDGLEVCRRIRAQPWGRDMLMIALTGWGQEEDRQKSKDVGFDYHLVKPVDFPTLVRLLAESGNEAVGR